MPNSREKLQQLAPSETLDELMARLDDLAAEQPDEFADDEMAVDNMIELMTVVVAILKAVSFEDDKPVKGIALDAANSILVRRDPIPSAGRHAKWH